MKPTSKPQISPKWWKDEKPPEIKGAELDKALTGAEKALRDAAKNGDESAIDKCLAALESLESAVKKTINKECDKKKHKDVIAVLEKYEGLIETETERLEKLKEKSGSAEDGDGEDDESDDKIFQKDYLYKMIKLLRSTGKELKFGFGLNTSTPEDSYLLLRRKGKPELLQKSLKKAGVPNRLIAFGLAVPDEKDGKTLVFKLADSAGEPPQIIKLGRKFLRSDKKLRFRKLKLVLPGGRTIEDTEPDTEDDVEQVAGTGGGAGLSPQEVERIRKELEELDRQLDRLMAEHQVTV